MIEIQIYILHSSDICHYYVFAFPAILELSYLGNGGLEYGE